jgi:Ca2+-binding EF-hand superfamily protein
MTIAVAAAFAAPLAAQASPGSSGFSRLDDNGDGYISQAEWSGSGQAGRMGNRQGSGSGAAQQDMAPDLVVLTITPVAPPSADQQRESIFRSLDADSNGMISRREASANGELNPHFARLDGNGDGRLSRTEFNRVHPGGGKQQASSQQQQQASSGEESAASAGAGGTSQRSAKESGPTSGQPGDPVGAPEAFPDTPSSGGQPRPGPSWNPTRPLGAN